jgi:flagellar hook-associated protein 2
MSTIQLPGLMTGIDTSSLIQQLMVIESRRLATYQAKKANYEAEKSTLNELTAKVNALKSVISGLSDSDDLNIFNITSSDKDILTASTSSSANPGSHSIDIEQLATTETWIQTTSAFDFETDYVGGGKFIYSYNYEETVITAVEDETTLEDLVGLINNDANNPGVTASLLYYDDAYHLVLNGNDAGSDYQILINAKSTEVWEMKDTFEEDGENATLSTKITELTQFIPNSGLVGDEHIEITGTDHNGNAIILSKR